MSLIEQAAQRLEQLRKAGVDVPASSADEAGPRAVAEQHPGVDRPGDAKTVGTPEPESARTLESQAPQSRRVNVDLDVLAASGIIRPDAPRSRQADEFRVIGISLEPQGYGMVKTDFRNLPDPMPVLSMHPTPGVTNPELYYKAK